MYKYTLSHTSHPTVILFITWPGHATVSVPEASVGVPLAVVSVEAPSMPSAPGEKVGDDGVSMAIADEAAIAAAAAAVLPTSGEGQTGPKVDVNVSGEFNGSFTSTHL